MSTDVDHFEVHPHIGSIWKRFVELWAGYVGNIAITLTTGVSTVTIGSDTLKCVVISFDDGATHDIYSLIDAEMLSTMQAPCAHVASCPGWYAMPPPVTYRTGDRVSIDDWDAYMDGTRDSIWTVWCGATVGAPGSTQFSTPMTHGKVFLRYKPVNKKFEVIMDYSACTVWDTTTPYVPEPALGTEAGNRAQPVVIVGGSSGGAAIDTSAIVEAIESVSDQEIDYQANQYGDVWSIKARVRAT